MGYYRALYGSEMGCNIALYPRLGGERTIGAFPIGKSFRLVRACAGRSLPFGKELPMLRFPFPLVPLGFRRPSLFLFGLGRLSLFLL